MIMPCLVPLTSTKIFSEAARHLNSIIIDKRLRSPRVAPEYEQSSDTENPRDKDTYGNQ